MSDEPNDEFASIIADAADDGAEPEHIGMVVPGHAQPVLDEHGNVIKTASQVLEEDEARYFDSLLHDNDPNTSAAFPMVFWNEQGVTDMPSKADAAILEERFEMTAEEFVKLTSKEGSLP